MVADQGPATGVLRVSAELLVAEAAIGALKYVDAAEAVGVRYAGQYNRPAYLVCW